jgi:anti-sigma regulatory factor (Ser/Thr protein kinase)
LESVLSVARANINQQKLLECLTETESHFILDNDPTLIPLIGYLQQNLERMRLRRDRPHSRQRALQEALINAIHHGNLEVGSELRERDDKAYQRRSTSAHRRALPQSSRPRHGPQSPAEAVYVIRDEGPGFDPSKLPDPTDPSNLERVSGRGLLLIRTFMDEVHHNAIGNEITMVKRRDR